MIVSGSTNRQRDSQREQAGTRKRYNNVLMSQNLPHNFALMQSDTHTNDSLLTA